MTATTNGHTNRIADALDTNATTIAAPLRRFTNEDPNGQAKSLPQMREDLLALTGGWPKLVSGELHVSHAENELHVLKDANALMAFVGGQANVTWKRGPSFPTSAVFFEHLKQQASEYDSIERYPHHRPLERVLYHHPELPPPRDGLVDELLNYYCPATADDRELLRGFIYTLFWAGPPGSRPAFVFTNQSSSTSTGGTRETGRGIGKSSIVATLSQLAGGFIDIDARADQERLESRLLSGHAHERRCVRIDNVKSERFSWAWLERIITTPIISGHKLYQGDAGRTNHLTYAITMNGVQLSDDMASRSVVIECRRADRTENWDRRVLAFIEENRWSLIAEVIQKLNKAAVADFVPRSRHATWEAEVLARLQNPEGLARLIAARRLVVDADLAVAEAILDQLRHLSRSSDDRLRAPQVAEAVRAATDDRVSCTRLVAYLRRLAIPGLIDGRDRNGRFWCLSHSPMPSIVTGEEIG